LKPKTQRFRKSDEYNEKFLLKFSKNLMQYNIRCHIEHTRLHSPELDQTTGLRSHPKESRDLGSLSKGIVYTPNVLGELFPDLDLEQVAAEGDATRDVINKTVRMEEDPLTREKEPTRRHPETPKVSYCQSKEDMICYNCGNRGHAWSTCPNRSHLCKELNLSPSHLHHLGQRGVVGDDIEEAETIDGKNATTKVERLTKSFRDMGPHNKLKTKLRTKAALKAFPTTLLFPCSIQLNPGHPTKPRDEKSATLATDLTMSADAKPH
jgi:hypothetical protein